MAISSANVIGVQPQGGTQLLGVLGTLYQYAKADQLNRERILENEVNRQVKELYNGDLAAFAKANPSLYNYWAETFRMPKDPGQMSLEGRYELDRRRAWELLQNQGQFPQTVPQSAPAPSTPPSENVVKPVSQRQNVPVPPASALPVQNQASQGPRVTNADAMTELLNRGATLQPERIPSFEGITPLIHQMDYRTLRENSIRVLNDLYTRTYGPGWAANPELVKLFQGQLDESMKELIRGYESRYENFLLLNTPTPPSDSAPAPNTVSGRSLALEAERKLSQKITPTVEGAKEAVMQTIYEQASKAPNFPFSSYQEFRERSLKDPQISEFVRREAESLMNPPPQRTPTRLRSFADLKEMDYRDTEAERRRAMVDMYPEVQLDKWDGPSRKILWESLSWSKLPPKNQFYTYVEQMYKNEKTPYGAGYINGMKERLWNLLVRKKPIGG